VAAGVTPPPPRAPRLVVVEAHGVRWADALAALGDQVPLLEPAAEGRCIFAARGPSRVMGGDDEMARRLVALVAAHAIPGAGTRVGVGVADSRFAALVAAHEALTASIPVVVAPGDTPAWLAPRTVRLLARCAEVEPEVVGLLERLGLARLGDLAALEESLVAGRFGALGLEMHRLARGDDRHPVLVVAPPPVASCREVFDGAIPDAATVVAAAARLAGPFLAHFAARGALVTHVVVRCEHESPSGSGAFERLWYLPEGCTAATLVERVGWMLRDRRGGAVTALEVRAEGARAATGRQLGLWGGRSPGDDAALRAIDRLHATLGEAALRVAAPSGGRDPAEAYAFVPLAARGEDAAAPSPWRGAIPRPSPALLAAPGAPIEVCDAAGARVRVSARHEPSGEPTRVRLGARDFAVVGWAGPWPVEERWWDPSRRRRRARMQVVVRDDTGAHVAMLVALEDGAWRVAALYA
jgi:protein ImuB